MKATIRRKALKNHVERLNRRINKLAALSRSFSYYRLSIFIFGSLVTWASYTYLNVLLGSCALLSTLAIFSWFACRHRQVEKWIETFRIWLTIKSDQLARIDLNWAGIAEPFIPEEYVKKPLAIDLDITGQHSLHQLIDMTITREGSRLLAEWLSQSVPDMVRIEKRQSLVRELKSMAHFRDRFLLKFRQVSKDPLEGEKLLRWFKVDYSPRRLRWLLSISVFFITVNIILFLLNSLGRIPAYWIITLLLYGVFFYLNWNATGKFFNALVQMDDELGKFRAVFRFLEKHPFVDKKNLMNLCAPFRKAIHLPSYILKKVKFATAAIGLRMNPVMTVLLNILFPWDFGFALLANRYRKRVAQLLPVWLQTCYEMEALISLSGFAYLHPEYTLPEIVPRSEPILHTSNLGHPLIPPEQKRCNDFSLQELGEIVVVTGSNMSGKSTFIKTLGINLCLAYAGGPVNAEIFRSIPFQLHTCIRIKDSITDGLSYFYAEVKCLGCLLKKIKSEGDLPLFFLIDEIFKGTNNRERLIGSRSYLKALIGANGSGVLATHDLELVSLADQFPKVHNFHFRDHLKEGKLVFDYKIRPGASPTTNALKIMRMEGLPVEPIKKGDGIKDLRP